MTTEILTSFPSMDLMGVGEVIVQRITRDSQGVTRIKVLDWNGKAILFIRAFGDHTAPTIQIMPEIESNKEPKGEI